jgi:hypothetical protein
MSPRSASEKMRPKKFVRKELLFVRLGVRKMTFFIKAA